MAEISASEASKRFAGMLDTARAGGRTLVSTDARAFDDLPGVTYRTFA